MSSLQSSGSGVSRNLAIVKQYFKKPMTLVVAILSLIALVSQFMISSASTQFAEEITSALKAMGQEGNVDVSGSSGGVLSYILPVVVTLCLFMIFVTSIAPKGGPTIWFTILHVLSVLQLIFTALSALFVVVVEIVFIFSTKTLVTYAVNSDMAGMGNMTDDQLEALYRGVDSFRVTLLVMLLITVIIYAVVLYYINSQTAFLKSVTLTCRNPQLKSKGAVPYGNLSIAVGVLMLVGVVILYLMLGNAESNILQEMDIDVDLDFSAIFKPILIYSISNALYVTLRGYFAKGWDKFCEENKDFVYEAVGSTTRMSDASPMPTYKSTTRASKEARQQSQPYLIGEEEDPNKKSSYIPEELQNDYTPEPQMYGQQAGFMGGDPYGQPQGGFMGGDPYGQQGGFMGGNPYGQPQGGPQYGGDPFGQSPMGGNPYDPYGQGGQGGGYNNGMM